MSFFWPTKIKADPNMLTRLARVLHWGLTLFAFFPGVPAIYLLATHNPGFVEAAAAALASLIGGRVLRYVLAGE